jgi:hypothetical protein
MASDLESEVRRLTLRSAASSGARSATAWVTRRKSGPLERRITGSCNHYRISVMMDADGDATGSELVMLRAIP